MENSFKSIIDQSKSLLILLPSKPFFDQVAAGLALFLALREQKSIQIASDSEMIVEFNKLIGVNKINQEIGNKNLIIRFVDYPANDIERVSYDIEDGQFRLSVIPKSKIDPPGKDQVNMSYSGVSADTVLLIGGANENHFGLLSSNELANAKLVHIGTKNLTTSKEVISFSAQASSASEIVARLLFENGYKVDQDIATNLIMGIEDASENFTSSDVNAVTFEVFAELLRAGGRRDAKPQQQQDYPPGAIPGQRPTAGAQKADSGQRTDDRGQRSQPPQRQSSQTQQQSEKSNDSSNNQNKQADNQSGDQEEQAPKDWLEPKIFKGTSIK